MKRTYKTLTPEEEVIVHKGTEAPGTGEYDDFFEEGTYLCRRCHAPLYSSDCTVPDRNLSCPVQ